MKLRLPAAELREEAGLHAWFAAQLGFPSFYGANWDAWVDCLRSADDPAAGMVSPTWRPTDTLELTVVIAPLAPPDWLDALQACAQDVNEEARANGRPAPVIALRLE